MRNLRLAAGSRTRIMGLALALGLGLAAARAEASPMMSQAVSYNTSGTVGDSSGPISFIGALNQSFLAPGTINLGQFHAGSLPMGASLTYNTPFTISGDASTIPANGPNSATGTFQILGTLAGTLTGNSGTTMFATVNSITSTGTLPFTLGSLQGGLDGNPIAVAPNGINGGNTTLSAQVQPAPVPEPATITLFVSAVCGLALRRRLRATPAVA